jgi:3-hydroxyisobutyrate dehydrogenase-like beta-hydroxyacid dehydrogenase
MKPVVGYIGLGDIGAPMAGRIIPGGFDLVVWNRTASKMDPLVEAGAKAAASPADLAAQCDIVCLCLDSFEANEQVIFGDNGLVHGGRAKLIVDNSTLHPQKVRDFAARVEAAGLRYIDAPVSGGSHGARMGTLAIMAGGDAADIEVARPVLMTYANRVTHMGGQGAGMATKICNQILLFGVMLAIAEVHTMGERFGVQVDNLPEALAGGFADSAVFKEFTRARRAGEDTNMTWHINRIMGAYQGDIDPDARGKITVALKDAGIAQDLGRIVGAPMPVSALFDTMCSIVHYQNAR